MSAMSLIIGFFGVGVYIPLSWKQRRRGRVQVCESASTEQNGGDCEYQLGLIKPSCSALKAFKVHSETLQVAVRTDQRG